MTALDPKLLNEAVANMDPGLIEAGESYFLSAYLTTISVRFDVLENENGQPRFCRVVLYGDGKRQVKVIKNPKYQS